MSYEPDRHHRRSIRLRGYDYSQAGAYFITVCTKNRTCLFGHVINGVMRLNSFGQIVDEEWRLSSTLRNEIELDAWVVMPNHVHGIVIINDVGAYGHTPLQQHGHTPAQHGHTPAQHGHTPAQHGHTPAQHGHTPVRAYIHTPQQHGQTPIRSPIKTVGAMIRGFKSAVTKRINVKRQSPGISIWQRNYYERIIRNDDALNRIRQYIINNPAEWAFDRENCQFS